MSAPAVAAAAPSAPPRAVPPSTTGEIPAATPTDLRAIPAIDRTTLRAEALSSFTLDVTNIANHAVSFPDGVWLGVSIDGSDAWGWGVVPRPVAPLEPGERRLFRGEMRSQPGMLGSARVTPAILEDGGDFCRCAITHESIPGAPSIPVTVIPPGWSFGEPLDPSQGKWDVAVSADSLQVAVGEAVTLHTTVTNVGTEKQRTQAYTALSIGCGGPPPSVGPGRALDHATLDPGAEQTFSTEFRPLRTDVGRVSCWVGIQIRAYGPDRRPLPGLRGRSVTITVLPAPSKPTASSTSAP